MARKDELLEAISEAKGADSLDALFLAVVNIVELRSELLIAGELEAALAAAAFGVPEATGTVSLGSRVSRKKDFIPPLTYEPQCRALIIH